MKPCNALSSPQEIAVRDTLLRVIDPEVGINIVDLGLVYGLDVRDDFIGIDLTMTSPACPMGEMILEDLHGKIQRDFPDARVEVELVWEPPWDPEMMSDRAKSNLGWQPR